MMEDLKASQHKPDTHRLFIHELLTYLHEKGNERTESICGCVIMCQVVKIKMDTKKVGRFKYA